MLKKLSVSQVVIGMFIHELSGSWMDHPFWKSGFLLTDADDLLRLQGSAVTEVWIDITKGLDCADGETQAQAEQRSEQVLRAVMQQPVTPMQVSMTDELRRAELICLRSKDAVTQMFSEVRMGQAMNNGPAQVLVSEVTESVLRHPNALLSMVRVKEADEYTYMHSVAVCALMAALARELGLPEKAVYEAGMAGLLHDVGKMAIDDAVLNKPGSLTDEEFLQIKRHPEYGVRYLQNAVEPVSSAVLNACLSHHEKIDGSGYPMARTGDNISLLARMAAVCDVYDALTSDRPYKKAWGPAETIQRMAQWQGHFDPHIFQAFVRTVGIYPVGSLVRLKSERLAVVLEQSEDSLLVPKVKVFFSAKSRLPLEQEILDLASNSCGDCIVSRESVEEWGFRHFDALWLKQ